MRPVCNVFKKLSCTEQRREGVAAYLWSQLLRASKYCNFLPLPPPLPPLLFPLSTFVPPPSVPPFEEKVSLLDFPPVLPFSYIFVVSFFLCAQSITSSFFFTFHIFLFHPSFLTLLPKLSFYFQSSFFFIISFLSSLLSLL
jgi:hypothetical protein